MGLFGHRRPKPRPPKRVGLALGGGAVRGAAHLGVLSVLEREGVPIAMVAGTSVGAIVGAGIAAGIPTAELWERFQRASWTRIATPVWGSSRLGLLDANPLGKLIERVTNAETIEQLGLPFAAVACDVLIGERVVLSQGPLRRAVLASAAVPGFFEPVRMDGRILADGGLVDNLPVDVVRAMGADYVIAVDIMPPLDGSYIPHDVRDMLMMSLSIVQHGGAYGRDRATIISPAVGAVSLTDFSKAPAAYEAGVQAAQEILPALRLALAGEHAPRPRPAPAGERPL